MLSKSKYLLGLQCPKYLWTVLHEPEKIPEPDKGLQHRFDQGHLVGELAKTLFPEGENISCENFKENLDRSKEALKLRIPLFEPSFIVNGLFARADVLKPVNEDEWDIIEVKSSTGVKDVNVEDVAFQRYCYEKAGLKIRKCFLMHINNEYVKQGDIKPEELFTIEDITEHVDLLMEELPEKIKKILELVSSDKCPDIGIGVHCNSPYGCPVEECWNFLPECNVSELYRGGKKCFELIENGVHEIQDIPDDFKLNVKQEIQKECSKTGKPHINKANLKEFLDKLEYPLYYLDFETFNTAIPLFDGTRPYQQVPFQFSLHVQNGSLKHYEFLAKGKEDPRKEFGDELKKVLGEKGSIIVFNQSFEIGRLKELAEAFPEYKEWVESVIDRVVDLLVPFRNFDYYDSSQQGSASIKKVLPAITGKSYDDLDINDGSAAFLSFLHITFDDVDEKEVKKTREDLLKYCCLDTEGMVWIVEELEKF